MFNNDAVKRVFVVIATVLAFDGAFCLEAHTIIADYSGRLSAASELPSYPSKDRLNTLTEICSDFFATWKTLKVSYSKALNQKRSEVENAPLEQKMDIMHQASDISNRNVENNFLLLNFSNKIIKALRLEKLNFNIICLFSNLFDN